MRKIIFILIVLFLLTACGGPKMPEIPMPESPPDHDLMQPTSSPPID